MILDISPQALQKIFSVEPPIYALQKEINLENYSLQCLENEMCRYLNLKLTTGIVPEQVHTVVVLPAVTGELLPELFTLLQKILEASKMEVGVNVVVVFSHQVMCRLAFIQQHFCHCKNLILLGTNFFDLDVQVKSGGISNYQPFVFQNYKWLLANSLEELQASPDLKKKLWGALKTVFGL